MTKQGRLKDQLVIEWVDCYLSGADSLFALPLSDYKKSPWGVAIDANFISQSIGISYSEAHWRRCLTLPLIEKMVELRIVVKDASVRENMTRQRILYWYRSLSFEEKKQLPMYCNNVSLASMGSRQRSWANLATQSDLIGKTVDDIHDDLHKLGLIGSDYKKVSERKRPITDAKQAVIDWVNLVSKDIDALWELSISRCSKSSYGFNVSPASVGRSVGIAKLTAQKNREHTLPLIEKMLEADIVVAVDERDEVMAVDMRRELLNWYRKLSIEEKKALPIFGNRISFKRIPKNQHPFAMGAFRYTLVKEAWSGIHQDLEKLGVIEADYKSVAERVEYRESLRVESVEGKAERQDRLSSTAFNVVADFLEPTEVEPFIQVEQLFAAQSNVVASDSGKSNYQCACSLFIEFLQGRYGNAPFYIRETADEHMLSRFRNHLEQLIIGGEVSSHHANTTLSSTRTTLRRLTQVRDLGYSFFDINGFEVNRETYTKKPFSKRERALILEAVIKGLEESRLSLRPYQKTGIGENPLNKEGGRIRGKSNLDNARWLFENRLSCTPVHFSTAETPVEKAFLAIIADSDKGLMDVYSDWGVVPMVSMKLIVPYLLRLAQVTGMNAAPLLALDIDDYVESHPATNRPCLRYWKERSDGHKEYHLDLFKAELTWLASSQAKAVKEVFDEMVQLTSSIRQNIQDEESENRLFIYQSDGVKTHKRVSSLVSQGIAAGFADFVDKYGLKDDAGEPLVLNISRFRPTFVSEMIDNGVSLREIQLMLGHSSIQTTIGYLDSLDFNSISRLKLNDKLKEIHASTLEESTVNEEPEIAGSNEGIEVIFQTPLAGCKNIFNPPDFVKNLSSYTPGSPCSQYNKCIGCDNVIITQQNLPEIFAMQRDYLFLIERSLVMETPYGHVVRENLDLIQGIVDAESSDFTQEELEVGRRLSEYIEATILVDGVVL